MIRNGLKQTIFTSSGLELLQMVSEPDTRRCGSEDANPQGVDYEIPHWLERRTKHFLQKHRNFFLVDAF